MWLEEDDPVYERAPLRPCQSLSELANNFATTLPRYLASLQV